MKKVILAIDDNEDQLELTEHIFRREGYDVFTAKNSDHALLLIEKLPRIDLILLDMQLSGMSGVDFLDIFEKELPNKRTSIPVVFLTGLDNPPLEKVNGFIPKMSEIDDFVREVRKFVGPAIPSLSQEELH